MSSAYEPAILAAEASADARALFIRRTYGHLAGAILAFVAVETALVNIPGIGQVIDGMFGSMVGLLIVVGLFMGASYIANVWAQSDTSVGMQYLGLSLYVAVEAVIFLPIIYFAAFRIEQSVIPTAGILTLSIFGGLSAAALITKKDYSFLGPILSVGMMLIFGLMIAGLLFGFSLGLWFSFAMVAFASACILYQTSNMVHYYRTDQHVAAALGLFASVATLFYYILRIAIATRD